MNNTSNPMIKIMTKMKNNFPRAALVAGALASAALGATAHAQSADTLVDKLVEKGILTVKEAKELRDETDKDFTRAFAAKTGMPDWVTAMKWNGDFRGRYEGFYSDNPAAVDRNRLQYRVRLGLTVDMLDNLEVGLRLASIGDTANNPISSNQTLDNNASKKGLSLDLAYGKWTAVNNSRWLASVTVGKMENPLQFTPIVTDPDYTPEGFGQQVTLRLNPEHDLKLNLGQFVLEERSASSLDTYMLGAQMLWDARWGQHWTTTLGLGALAISGKDSLTTGNGQLNIGEGNSRIGGAAAGAPLHHFNPIIADAAVGYTFEKAPLYPGAFPVKLAGEFMHNPAAPRDNEGYSVKLTLGKAGKRKTWEASYEYRELQRDAIYEELPESDFNAFTQAASTAGGTGGFVNGTNVRGHIGKIGYSPTDSLTFFVTYWLTENISETPAGSRSRAGRLQVDAVWKF